MSLGLPLLLTLVATANPYLAEGQKLHDGLRFQEAIERLTIAVKVQTNSVAERRLAHHLLARCQAALGRADEAELAYVALLQSDPNAPAPENASPKLVQAYLTAKRRLFPPDLVRLSLRMADGAMIVAEVRDPWARVARVSAVGPSARELVLVQHEGLASANLPPDLASVGGAWTLLAKDSAGVELARVPFARRGAAVPRAALSSSAAVDAATDADAEAEDVQVILGTTAQDKAWLRWSTLGAAIAATAGTAALAFSSRADADAAGRAPFASETQALDRRAHGKAVAAHWLGGAALGLGATSAVLFLAW